jgi:hypothetical protein
MPLFDTPDVRAAISDAAVAVKNGQPFPQATFGKR